MTGRSSVWQSVWFGTRRPKVQILSPRLMKHYIVRDEELQIHCKSEGEKVDGVYSINGKEVFTDDNNGNHGYAFAVWLASRSLEEQARWGKMLYTVLEQIMQDAMSEVAG